MLTPAAAPWLMRAPTGDGHPVLVLPGLFTGDAFSAPLRTFLAARGWTPYGWGRGINVGLWDVAEKSLAPTLRRLVDRHGTQVSLVGASMGGLFARWLATRFPALVRCVITMGTGVVGPVRANHVWPIYELVTGQDAATLFHAPPPVPSTSIYSRLDGLTNWQCCLQPPAPGHENIELVASHHGYMNHPASLLVVADRLARPRGRWQPFTPPAWAAAWYPAATDESSARG
jgi:pimeloyl-ACP methyl ester carboxylesterase